MSGKVTVRTQKLGTCLLGRSFLFIYLFIYLLIDLLICNLIFFSAIDFYHHGARAFSLCLELAHSQWLM